MKRLLLIILAALPMFAQTAPVPAERLRGNTLLGEHFALPAPGADWQWLRLTAADEMTRKAHPQLRQESFIVTQPETHETFVLTATADEEEVLPNAMFMAGMEDGVLRTAASMGSTMTDFHSAPSPIPIDGASYRFHYKITSADGSVIYRIGYIGGIQTKYQLMVSVEQNEEPAAFTKFAKGFQSK